MLIKEWLPGFLAKHQDRHVRQDWPAEGSPEGRWLWNLWFNAFRDAKVTPIEAETASRRLVADGLASPEDHIQAILDAVGDLRLIPSKTAAIGLVWASTPEARKAQCEALVDEVYNAGFEFQWDRGVNQFRCVPSEGAYRAPTEEMCLKIRFFNAGLWKLLAAFREPDVAIPQDLPRSEWRALVAALAARGNLTEARA